MPQPSTTDVHFEQLLTKPQVGAVEKRIVQQDGQYCIKSESGKPLGCYDTREEAVKRLGQIEFFKMFADAHTALHDAYDEHNFSEELTEATSGDVRAVLEAHERLVTKATELGIEHEPDPDSRLDVLTDVVLAKADSSWQNMHKSAVQTNDELRYSLAPLYIPGVLDAHAEWTSADSLQKAVWELALSGDTDVQLQHHPDIRAGQRVGLLQWPYAVQAEFIVPDATVRKARRVRLPADTVFQGTIWDEWAWPLVKSGRLLGLSMGGWAKRVNGPAPFTVADFGEEIAEVAKAAWFSPVPEPEVAPEPPRKRWFGVRKHGQHDQKTHGNRGGGRQESGGGGMSFRPHGDAPTRGRSAEEEAEREFGEGGGRGRDRLAEQMEEQARDITNEDARENRTASGHRPLDTIAREIASDWGAKTNFGAKPYLAAMRQLHDIKDMYGADSADSVVAYFLSNATTWRGDTARRIKAELKGVLRSHNPKVWR